MPNKVAERISFLSELRYRFNCESNAQLHLINAVTVDVGNGTARGARRCGPSLVNLVSPFDAREEEPHGASKRACPPAFRRVGDCDAENAATVHYVSEVHHLKRGGSLL